MTVHSDSAGSTGETSFGVVASAAVHGGNDEVQSESQHDAYHDDVKAPASFARKSSFVGTFAKVGRQLVHFGLLEEDDGPPVRSISALDGQSVCTPRTALPKRKQIRLLCAGALDDVKQRNLFSPYDSDRILNFFDGVISFVAVFLYEALGWEPMINFRENPKPVLLSLLCYFHIAIYWLNVQ